ncbi:unnamed protein product [Mytilus coruscus]|uniref:Novel STAND NTPase 3 domain-containing protein n=1 Tax=Mytilus coruscus TaxID=42192 RepID=A0A6J8A0T4_MYTCO|nr:unnamed protein product [Mytilus coruscus]
MKFVPTKASKYVLKCLKDKNCVTVVGSPGVGKTAITRHVALHLTGMGYAVIPITDPRDIRDFYKPGQRSVFVIDHIGGKFTANKQMIDSWEPLMGVVEQILSDNCKIVLSCRSQVYKDKKFNVLVPFKSCECNVNILRFSPSERKNIAKAHLGNYDHKIIKISDYDFFPLLCVICSKQGIIDIEKFFYLSFVVLEKELNSLWDQGKVGRCQICALALCVINDNELQEKYLTSKESSARHVIDDVAEACGLNRGISLVKIKDEMDTLVGTYLTKINGIYTAIHNKVFDFLVYYCSTKILGCLI